MGRTTALVLGDELGAFVSRMVESGRYGNQSEVLRAALRKLEAEELRVASQWAYLDALPATEPDEDDRASIARIEAERASGAVDELSSPGELRAEWARQDGTAR